MWRVHINHSIYTADVGDDLDDASARLAHRCRMERRHQIDEYVEARIERELDLDTHCILVSEKKPWWSHTGVFLIANVFGLTPLIRYRLAYTADLSEYNLRKFVTEV